MKKGFIVFRKSIVNLLLLSCVVMLVLAAYGGNGQDLKTRVSPEKRIAPVDYVAKSRVGSCDAPTDFKVDEIKVKNVYLSWKSPEELLGLYDGFENHTDFAINSAGDLGWSYLDLDDSSVYGIGDYVYPGRGAKMAYQVFNPSMVPNFYNPRATPHTGSKFLACFAAEVAPNNDWIISPELKFSQEFKITFFAASFDAKYGMERIKVGYSTTDKSPSSFTFVQGGNYLEIPDIAVNNQAVWNKYSFNIPADAKYVAINCVSNDAFVLMIDDIYISTNEIIPMKETPNYVLGFNVYRNGVKLNYDVVKDVTFIDDVPEYGYYNYSVEAVYADGCISEKTELKDVYVESIHKLPFYEDFRYGSFETNYWTLDPTINNGNDWKTDYIVGDTVQMLATYSSYIAKNYSHSLISKDLDAINGDNIWVRYDLWYDGYKKTTIEKLNLEVFNGTEWISVKEYTNQNDTPDGDMPKKREYVNISSAAAGKMFKIRFRANGEDAYNLMFWGVDNIKVWDMVSSTITGVVKHAGNTVEGVEVMLFSNEGDIFTSVTNANGEYKFENVEADDYKLRVYAEGYNNWGLDIKSNEGLNNYDITLTAPNLVLPDGLTISETMSAEEIRAKDFRLQNSGDGDMKWCADVTYDNYKKSAPNWDIAKTFTSSDLLQQSIAFDGEYFYAGSAVMQLGGNFWKYDRNGRFIEEFMIKDIKTTYNLTYDGLYFYACSGGKFIYVLDFDKKILVKKIEVEGIEELKHLCYDSGTDSFWGGSMYTIANIGKDGKLLNTVEYIDAVCTGSAYDPYNVNGSSIWLFDQSRAVEGYGNSFDLVTIRRYDVKTRKLTKEFHSATDLPNFPHGRPEIQTFGTGLFGTTELFEGRFTLLGIISHDPSLIFAYDMYEIPNWIKTSVNNGGIAAGESIDLGLTLDALKLKMGDVESATIKFRTMPNVGTKTVDVALNINAKADYASPSNLTGSVIDDKAVMLNWTAADGNNEVVSYNVYCNGKLLRSTTEVTLTDENLKSGSYAYYVTAVYAGGEESRRSNEVRETIKLGIPCYYPYNLKAENISNKNVKLTWSDPNSSGMVPVTLRWDNGINNDGIGMGDGGTIRLAVKWDANELVDYRNMKIASVTFFPYDLGEFKICVYQNKELVYSQSVSGLKIGEYNTVRLSEPLYVDATKELMIGYDVKHDKGRIPVGVDAGPAVNGKGNMVYFEDTGWNTLLQEVGMNVNYNIAVNLEPATGKSEDMAVLGYNVYRDGDQINSELLSELEYEDKNVAIGTYTYNVTAKYAICESNFSNDATCEIFDIKNHNAPLNLSANVVLNRNIDLSWDYPVSSEKGGYEMFGFVDTFRTKDAGEQAVASDNEFIYTTYWQKQGVFNKYTMDGTFVEQFVVEGVPGIRDLTFDGQFFYGGMVSPKLYKLDLKNKVKVGEFTVPYEVRHCTFIQELDGGLGGFEIGDWNSSVFITMNGAIIKKGANIDGAFGSAYYKGKMYYFCQTGDSKCEIHEYELSTNLSTGVVVDLADYYQYEVMEGATAGGISTVKYANGSIALLANIQESRRNRIVAVELEGNRMIKGFNIYKNGVKMNDEILCNRYFGDYESVAGTYSYDVEAIYVDDVLSPKSTPVQVAIVPSDYCEKPVNLKAFAEKRDVVLSWNANESISNIDNVESYQNFSMGSNANWTMVDLDNKRPKVIDGITFENMGNPCAFMVFDFTATTPAMNNIAYSGNKVFASFSPMDNFASNDWMISKALSFDDDFKFSFMARGLNGNKFESFRVAYSTTGSNPSDFVFITKSNVQVMNKWERFEYSIPGNAKYVAINGVSKDGSALLIDDIAIGGYKSEVYGYNIYRDGVKLNSELLKVGSYIDLGVEDGTYKYKVNAMYTTSCVSDFTDELTVKMDYSLPCYAPTKLSAEKVKDGISLSWVEPVIDESKKLSYSNSALETTVGVPNGGIYAIGSKWDAADLRLYNGYSIYEVTMFIGDMPNEMFLVIYQDNKIVYEQQITGNKLGDFNTFVLETPYKVDINKNLLISIYADTDEEMFPFGIDKGPAVVGKGDLWTLDGGLTWQSVGSSGNWCMSALLEIRESDLKSGVNRRIGYNVYCNDIKLNGDLLTTTYYKDKSGMGGWLTYKVAAVYSECGEALSEGVKIKADGVDELESGSIAVYPNPAKGSDFTIRNSNWRDGDVVEIYDYTGKKVYSMIVDNMLIVSNGEEVNVHCGEFADGVYVVRIVGKDKVNSVKLIIKK